MYQFPHKSILDTDQFSKEDLDFIIQKTNIMKQLLHSGKSFGMLNGKLLASLFNFPLFQKGRLFTIQ